MSYDYQWGGGEADKWQIPVLWNEQEEKAWREGGVGEVLIDRGERCW